MNIESTPELDHAMASLTTEDADLLLRICRDAIIGWAGCIVSGCQCGESLHNRITQGVEKGLANKLFCHDDIVHVRTILGGVVKIAADIIRKSAN